MIIDLIISILDWTIKIEHYHPRKCYFLLGLLTGIIIKVC
jgi:hypothetical protein